MPWSKALAKLSDAIEDYQARRRRRFQAPGSIAAEDLRLEPSAEEQAAADSRC